MYKIRGETRLPEKNGSKGIQIEGETIVDPKVAY